MPEAIMMLQSGESFGMSFQQFHDFSPLRMVGRQHVEHLTHGENSPAIGSSPEKGRMRIHALNPPMTEQFLFRHPHPTGKLKNLTSSLIIIFGIARKFTHISHSRNTHEHIIEPYRILLRTNTGKSAIGNTVFLIHDIVGIVVYKR